MKSKPLNSSSYYNLESFRNTSNWLLALSSISALIFCREYNLSASDLKQTEASSLCRNICLDERAEEFLTMEYSEGLLFCSLMIIQIIICLRSFWISVFFLADIWILVRRSFVATPRSTKSSSNWLLTSLTHVSFNFLRIVSASLMTSLLITKRASWLVKLSNLRYRKGSIRWSVWKICKKDLNMLTMNAKN